MTSQSRSFSASPRARSTQRGSLSATLSRTCRTPTAYASLRHVDRTPHLLDEMETFLLAETFKYLFLLFSDPAELPRTLDLASRHVLTTEAHVLPIVGSDDARSDWDTDEDGDWEAPLIANPDCKVHSGVEPLTCHTSRFTSHTSH